MNIHVHDCYVLLNLMPSMSMYIMTFYLVCLLSFVMYAINDWICAFNSLILKHKSAISLYHWPFDCFNFIVIFKIAILRSLSPNSSLIWLITIQNRFFIIKKIYLNFEKPTIVALLIRRPQISFCMLFSNRLIFFPW